MKRGKVLVGIFVATLMVGAGALVFFHVPFAEQALANVGSWSVSSLTVNPYSSSQVSLQWSCSPTGTGINETVYEYYCTGSGCSPTSVYTSFNSTCPSSPTVQSITGTGNFSPGTSVTFQVCTGGAYGTCTNTASATTLPSNPGTLSATPQSQSSISLSWGASSGASGYYIYRNGSYLTATGITSYTNSGLSAGTTYSYYVVAYNSGGNSGASNTASATTDAATPGTPTITGLSPASQSSYNVTWNRNSPYDESGFNFYIWTGAYSNVGPYGSAGAGATSGTASGFGCGSSYNVYVVAYVNTNGRTYFSGPSSYYTAMTDACTPGQPSSVSASPTSQTTANVYWTRNSPYDESGFFISISYVGGWYASSGSTSAGISGLSAGTGYTGTIQSYVNTNGRTYYSPASSFSVTTDAQTPGTPSGVTFTSYASQTYIPVSWTPTAPTDQSGFVATLNDSGLGMVMGSATAGPSATSVNVPMSCSTGGNSNYVQAYVNTNGRTYYSSPGTGASAKTSACTPSAPSASSISASSITITWPAVPLATYYHVSQNPPNLDVGTVTTNSFTASGLSCATSYTFMIYACDGPNNTTGCSPWGAPATITTSACPDTTPPTVSASNSSSGWYNSSPTVTVSASDTGGSGLAFVKYTWNNNLSYCWASGITTSNGASLTIPGQGSNTLYLCAQDGAGNQGTWSGTYNLDTTAPATPSVSASPSGWTNGNVTISVSASDTGGSGLKTTYYRCNTSNAWSSTASASFTYACSLTGGQTAQVYSTDNAGNTGGTGSTNYYIDTTAPPSPSLSPTSYGWGRGPVTVSFSASDTGGSGTGGYHYCYTTNGSTCSPSTAGSSVTLSSQAQYTLCTNAYDNAGNTGGTTCSPANVYKIDTTAPAAPSLSPTSALTNNSNITVSFSASDTGGSGTGGYHYCYTTNGSTCPPSTAGSSVTFSSVNSYTVCANAYDNAGNTSGTTCSSANAYQYTSVSAPSSSGVTVNTAPVSGLSTINSTWSGTASGFNVYVQGGQYSTSQLLSSSAASSGNTNAISLQCPSSYTFYTVAYNTDNSLSGGTSASCSGAWGSIPNAQCTVKTTQVKLTTCTQGFFGQ